MSPRSSLLRAVAFTDRSRVTAQNQAALQRFCEGHIPYLDVLFVPAWYDGDKENTVWESPDHLSERWDLFNPGDEE
jgi:hypothetical protein